MKVVHIQKTTGVSGSERHLLSLLPALANRGVEVTMVVLAAGESYRFVDTMRSLGVEVVSIPAGPDLSPGLVWRLVAELRRQEPDLVHTHLIHADLQGQLAARIAGMRGVSTVHSTHKFYRRQPYRSLVQAANRSASATIAISQYVAQMLSSFKLASTDRVHVVPYGIDVRHFETSSQDRRDARVRFGVDDDTTAVGIASRLIAHKGHEFLIEGVAAAQAQGGSFQLLVAGDGPLREELERLCADLLVPGSARFVGFVDDVRSFMAACDVSAFLTQPELSEGFGLAALEAMAAGLPVIVTDMGPLPELVVAGETGFVVAPRAVDELAVALSTLAEDPVRRAKFGRHGCERATLIFGLDRMVSSTIGVYDEVLGA